MAIQSLCCFELFFFPRKGGLSYCSEREYIQVLLDPSKMVMKGCLDYVDVCINFWVVYVLSKEDFLCFSSDP